MASVSSIAIRRATAETRIKYAAERIGRAAEIAGPPVPTRAKDPALRATADMEWVADLMRAIADNLDPDGKDSPDVAPHVVNEYVAPPPDASVVDDAPPAETAPEPQQPRKPKAK